MEPVRQDALFRYRGDRNCPICLDSLSGTVWAHEDKVGLGYDHPMHEVCRSNLVQENPNRAFRCTECRVRLARNVINPEDFVLQVDRDPILFDYHQDEKPQVFSDFLESRKQESFDTGLYDGAFLLSTCFTISMIFLRYVNYETHSRYLITPSEQLASLGATLIQIVPPLLKFIILLINPDYTESYSLGFKLHRTVAKVHHEEMHAAYIKGIALSMLLILGLTLSQARRETNLAHLFDTPLEHLLIQFGLPLVGIAACTLILKLPDYEAPL